MAGTGGKRVLIVDDADESRLIAEKILSSAGHLVQQAKSVAEALAAARSSVPDLILVDLVLEGESGFDFLKERASDPALKNVPVVVVSGKSDVASVHEAVALGASGYLLKPYVAAALLQKLRKAVRGHSLPEVVFPQPVPVVAEVFAEILRGGEAGLCIESRVRLGANQPVAVESSLIDAWEIAGLPMRTAPSGGSFAQAGRYWCEVSILGLDQKRAQKIREKMARNRE